MSAGYRVLEPVHPFSFVETWDALREIAVTLPGRKERKGRNPSNKSALYSA